MPEPPYPFSLSVVVPVFDDEEVLVELHRRLVPVLEQLTATWEIVFVDDGSRDGSWKILDQLHDDHPGIRLLKMSRNFGQDGALTAGLRHATGDVIVIMDSDLQDRPEDVPKLIAAMVEDDVPMAITRWTSRQDGAFKVGASRLLHAITSRITSIRHRPGLGVFRVMRREVLEALDTLPECTSTSLSRLYWLGFEYAVVDLERDPRYAGTSGYTLGKMVKLAFDRIFSYSIFPIRLAIVLGTILSVGSLLFAVFLVAQRLFMENVLPGWTSLIVVVLFLFGVTFLFLGIIGEYLGRIFLESTRRPKFVVARHLEPSPRPEADQE